MILELWRGAGGFSLMLRGHRPSKKHQLLDCCIEAEAWDEVENALPALLAVPPRDLDDLPIVGDIGDVLKVKAEDYLNERDPSGTGADLVAAHHIAAEQIRSGKRP